jgi:hypothetical protein
VPKDPFAFCLILGLKKKKKRYQLYNFHWNERAVKRMGYDNAMCIVDLCELFEMLYLLTPS